MKEAKHPWRGKPFAMAAMGPESPNYAIFLEGKLLAVLAEITELARAATRRDLVRCRTMLWREDSRTSPEEREAFLADRAAARKIERELLEGCSERWKRMRAAHVGSSRINFGLDGEAAETKHDLDAAKEQAALRRRILHELRECPPWEDLAPRMSALRVEAEALWGRYRERDRERGKPAGGISISGSPDSVAGHAPATDEDMPF